MGKRVILFDLDGTLHDSESVYVNAFETSFMDHQDRPLTPAERAYLVGKPLERVLDQWLPDKKASFLTTFFKNYESLSHLCKPYEGVIPLIQSLHDQDYKLGIVSSKIGKYVKAEMESTGLLPFFQEFVCVDDVKNPKPDAEPIHAIMDLMGGVDQNKCLFIGDQWSDMKAAKNAGITGVGATWGEGEAAKLLEHGAKYILTEPHKLFHLLQVKFTHVS
ncbi:phosphoglycolate phosphatase/pyrophosphatase PpaX [Bacillus oleivorans]|uniref:Phosphoglycolate phosphatase/pyrophosphatase PpaX n=1 Tax=Bacillus oleivorans TaxID=1448271 RepID=A0A285CHH2_9BACI|nr:HAD-IA family hydrolase [Bacillus oleivorans]SNX67041.1 phosphoglycolate phosphatase/pyrophosphatase PpaX [Bacillus oleivorans]